MMPEEWPISTGSGAGHERNARARRGDRLRTVRADLFLPPAGRLTEQERALMTAMLHCLVSDVADALRAALPRAAANDGVNVPVVEALLGAGLLDREGLIRLLLRRADEERIASAARARSGPRDGRSLQALVSHGSAPVAAAAMSLIIARGKRRDRFGQCLLHLDDLPRREAEVLVHSIAAALRSEIRAGGEASADNALSHAANQVLGTHDQAAGLESLSAALIARLRQEDDLSDERIVAAAADGEILLVASALAARAGLAPDVVFDEMTSGEPARIMMLLRIGEVGRQSAAELLAGVGDLLGIADPGQAIGIFEELGGEQIDDARAWLGADSSYRSAAAVLGTR